MISEWSARAKRQPASDNEKKRIRFGGWGGGVGGALVVRASGRDNDLQEDVQAEGVQEKHSKQEGERF